MKRRESVLRREGAGAWPRGPRFVALIAAAMGLSGCASMSQTIAEKMSQMPAVGLSASAPERPADPLAYPAVHDMPPPRDNTVLTDLEQQKLEDDLVTARNQQRTATGAAVPARSKPSRASVIPASSSRTIY